MKQWLDFVPLLLFLITFKVLGIFPATAVLIASTVALYGYLHFKEGRLERNHKIILVATVGKLGGAMLTARMTGVGWLDSFSLGALMNTRGLIELIALNVGYDLGILSPRIFAMLVLMALVTTAMTGPLLSLADYLRSKRNTVAHPAVAVSAED